MKATIVEREEIAQGTLLVTFSIQEPISFKPGQFFFITLLNPPYTDQEGDRRHFSIVNSPMQDTILQMATRLRNSAFKKSLQELPLGTEVEVGPIGGSFVLPEDTTRPLVFIAGGIGITPYISMLRYIREKNLPYTVTLLYSNRDRQSTAFLEDLERLTKEIPNFKLIAIMTQDEKWTGEKRYIDKALLNEYFASIDGSTYCVAGPPKMVEVLTNALAEAGVKAEHIKSENFTGYE